MGTLADLDRQGFDTERIWRGSRDDPRSLIGEVSTREHPLERAGAIFGLPYGDTLSHLFEHPLKVRTTEPIPQKTPWLVRSPDGS